MRWTSEGPCEICEPSDVSVLLIVIFLATLSLLSVYYAVNENRAKNNEHMVLLATLGSQLVAVFQMMGVCRRDSLRCIGFRLRAASGHHVHLSRLAHVPLPH